MEKIDLKSDFFWRGDASTVMRNWRLKGVEGGLVGSSIQRQLGGHLFFQTSGSSGVPKWVALSKHALLESAQAVNRHLGLREQDSWLNALPLFHVGGMGVMARAYLSGAKVSEYAGKWAVEDFVSQLQASEARWSAVVPAQVVDIVQGGLVAPPQHRGIIVGGGTLDVQSGRRAAALGWKLYPSYGMSEAGSQIATAIVPAGKMLLLDHIEARVVDSLLQWRGPSQFSGYVVEGKYLAHEGWVKTNDRVVLNGREVKFLGRQDRMVKVLGELVDVGKIENELSEKAGQEVVVISKHNDRRGSVLIPFVESAPSDLLVSSADSYGGVERLEPIRVRKFPRSPLGKIRRGLM